MTKNRCLRFTHTISRLPGKSCADGIRSGDHAGPDVDQFLREHSGYVAALAQAGVKTLVLPALEAYPDSVFVEDAALCLPDRAMALRPGAPSRAGEAAEMAPHLREVFGAVDELEGDGRIDGGDVLLTDTDAFIGLSERTDLAGVALVRPVLEQLDYQVRVVETPAGVLHFKSDCSVLDAETIFSTRALAESGCFDGYQVIETPEGEEAAANLIRVNDFVILRTGFPATAELLAARGYQTIIVEADEAAKLDGGLSCMSLRFALGDEGPV